VGEAEPATLALSSYKCSSKSHPGSSGPLQVLFQARSPAEELDVELRH
jgi:hypothetical protein